MKTLRRYDLPNRDYFLSVVSFNRDQILLEDVGLFWQSWRKLSLSAWSLLPEHFHVVLNPGNDSISDVMHDFKIRYSRYFRNSYRKGRVWQNRFWDHVIRDQDDWNKHIDYVHYNPVKHGCVTRAADWEHSSFRLFVANGLYRMDWGIAEPPEFEGEFGE